MLQEINNVVFENSDLNIHKYSDYGDQYLYFEFKNKFTLDACEKAVAQWASECKKDDTVAHIHIWDCQLMTSFEMSAKNLWMKHMVLFSNQIEKIVMISDNIVIRGAARLMSKFTTHHLEVYKSMPEWKKKEDAVFA